MKAKRLTSLFCALVFVLSLSLPASAAQQPQGEYVDLGDGFYMIVTTVQGPMSRAGDTSQGTKNATVYDGGTQVGTFSLTAEFDISGSTAKATRAIISGSGVNGWTYSGGTTSGIGNNRVYGTATFTNGSRSKSSTINIFCSPAGTIS